MSSSTFERANAIWTEQHPQVRHQSLWRKPDRDRYIDLLASGPRT